MDVRHIVFRLAGRSGPRKWLTLVDVRATLDLQRTKVSEGSLVSVVCGDRHGQAVSRHLPGKGDLPAHRRKHGIGVSDTDIHASMLSAGVLVVSN